LKEGFKMSVNEVRKHFTAKGLEDPVFKLDESGATVEMASKTIGVDPALIAKTLAFKVKDKNVLIVARGDSRIDNKKYKQFFNAKAKMLEHDEVLEITGHPVGGLCPFGLKTDLEVYLDLTIKDFSYVYPAAGATDYALKISPIDMATVTNGIWVDVCQSFNDLNKEK
jgi:Cys-tRNA(Pro) deacylase